MATRENADDIPAAPLTPTPQDEHPREGPTDSTGSTTRRPRRRRSATVAGTVIVATTTALSLLGGAMVMSQQARANFLTGAIASGHSNHVVSVSAPPILPDTCDGSGTHGVGA